MQSRHVDLKYVFEYPLGPHSWPLSTLTGGLRKTNNAALMHQLEKGVEPVVETIESAATIIDGMAMVQKVKASGVTYMQLAKQLLVMALAIERNSSRIDVVFDHYRERSIKNAERLRRGTASLVVKSIVAQSRFNNGETFFRLGAIRGS